MRAFLMYLAILACVIAGYAVTAEFGQFRLLAGFGLGFAAFMALDWLCRLLGVTRI